MFYIFGYSRSVDSGSVASNVSSMVEVSEVEGTSAVGTGVGFVCLSVTVLLLLHVKCNQQGEGLSTLLVIC